MNALRAQLMYALSHAGWAGALGAALGAFALALHLGAAAPLQAELDALQAERVALAERLSQGVTVESPREQVERFDATLVPRARVPSVLAELSHAAAATDSRWPASKAGSRRRPAPAMADRNTCFRCAVAIRSCAPGCPTSGACRRRS
jgi:hypothetical protein